MEIKDEFCTFVSSKRIVFKENRRRVEFINDGCKPCYKVRVDGGVLCNRIVKCDGMLIVSDNPKPHKDKRKQEHFIELKGVDVVHAVEQVKNTIPLLSNGKPLEKRCAYIVCANVAPAIKTKIQKEKLFLKKKYNCEMKIGESVSVEI